MNTNIEHSIAKEYWKNKLVNIDTTRVLDHCLNNELNKIGSVEPLELPSDIYNKLMSASAGNVNAQYALLMCSVYLTLHTYGYKDTFIKTQSDKKQNVYLKLFSDNKMSIAEILGHLSKEIKGAFRYGSNADDANKELDENNAYFLNRFMMTFSKMSGDMNTMDASGIAFHFQEKEGSITLLSQFNLDGFTKAQVQRISKNIILCLNSILKNSKQLVSEIYFLSNDEENRLINQFAIGADGINSEKPFHELFEEKAVEFADCKAITSYGKSYSFKYINEKANQIAHYIRKTIAPTADDAIAVSMEKSEKYISVILGILKSGACFVPIDPDLPTNRKKEILESSKSRLFFTENSSDENSVLIETLWKTLDNFSIENLNYPVANTNLAYIIFTSGTTGKPKGVMIEHQSLTNFVYAHQNYSKPDENTRVLAYSNISFDASLSEIWPYLFAGAHIFPVPEKIKLDMEEIVSFIDENDLNYLCFATPVYELIKPHFKRLQGRNIKIFVGGDKLHDSHPEWTIYNQYGPTEGTVVASVACIKPNETNITIGQPIAGMETYILDENLRPAPHGAIGDLYLSGEGISRGYYSEEKLTSDSFINNPLSNRKYPKIYKTGDLASFNEDGYLMYHGRSDFQVKVRGNRIELGEIETRLMSHNNVNNCSVNVIDEEICAFIVLESDIAKSDLNHFLSELYGSE